MNQEPSGEPQASGNSNSERPGARQPLLERHRWLVPTAWYGAWIFVLFGPVIWTMFKEYAQDESMGHGFFVPLVAGYIIWQRRQSLDDTEPQPHWSGWVLVVCGFGLLMLGTFGAEFALMRGGLLLTIYGVVVAACGLKVFRMLMFPLLLLLFMIRIPQFIYGQITFPLQILASAFAETSLSALGIPVLREGNVLELASQRLNVVEACSGIRSLVAIVFMCVLYNYFFVEKKSMRIWILACAIPIAILGNAARIVATGIAGQYNHAWVSGATHEAFGYVSVVVAAIGCIGVHMALLRFERMREVRHA